MRQGTGIDNTAFRGAGMKATERYRTARTKFDRAQLHVQTLAEYLKAYRDSSPFRIDTKRQTETRRLVYYVGHIEPTPHTVPILIGDCLSCLRSALDHLAFQLYLSNGGTWPGKHVSFPIFGSRGDYINGKGRSLKGIASEAILAIDALKPYKGGNDTLWQLNELNNIDKHRMVFTAGQSVRQLDIGPFMGRELLERYSMKAPEFLVTAQDKCFPLEIGEELFVDLPDAEPVDGVRFWFDLAFGEPGVVEGQPVAETLNRMVVAVDAAFRDLQPHLK